MPEYLLDPFDLLFFRDARPMAAGQGAGHGCRLPLPNTLHEALRAALLDRSDHQPAGQAHSRNHFTKRAASTPVPVASSAFQSLQTRGPFLYGCRERRPDDDEWSKVPERHKQPALRLPLPLDVVMADAQRLVTLRLETDPNAAPLSLLPVSPAAPTKNTPSGFWTPEQFTAYLRGDEKGEFRPLAARFLFEPEQRVGVEIDNHTFAAREGQLYAATYLRPARSTRFWCSAVIADQRRTEEIELLDSLDLLPFGGERRLARLESNETVPRLDPAALPAPDFAAMHCQRVKWTLLTPAIFAGGWRPGWIDADTFEVQLRRIERKERAARRKARREGRKFDPTTDNAAAIPARLVSVCLGRAQPVTGWDLVHHSAKPTQLAVPAGSVFYFECPTPGDAAALAEALHLRPRSDALGEKSYGLGVCGTWKLFEPPADDDSPPDPTQV